MKVFYRTKKTPEGNIIPYSVNIANALDGALQLGLECIPYFKVDEIIEQYSLGDITLDGIDQVQYCLDKFGIIPQEFNYPEILKPYLGRKIWKDTINSISSNEEKWSAGNFVKPIKEKVFTGKIISSIKDLIGCGSSISISSFLITFMALKCDILSNLLFPIIDFILLAAESILVYIELALCASVPRKLTKLDSSILSAITCAFFPYCPIMLP